MRLSGMARLIPARRRPAVMLAVARDEVVAFTLPTVDDFPRDFLLDARGPATPDRDRRMQCRLRQQRRRAQLATRHRRQLPSEHSRRDSQ